MRGFLARFFSSGTAYMIVLVLVLNIVLCPLSLFYVHAETARYDEPEKNFIKADDALKKVLSEEALEKLYNGTKDDGYWVKVVVNEEGKKEEYFRFPINWELTQLHKGIIVYGGPEDIKENFNYSQRPGFVEDPNGAYWAVKDDKGIYRPATANTPNAVRGWFRYAGITRFINENKEQIGRALSEIGFPPDVKYHAVDESVKIVKNPWENPIALSIDTVVQDYAAKIKNKLISENDAYLSQLFA